MYAIAEYVTGVFVAASVGAAAPVIFGCINVPGTEQAGGLRKSLIIILYVMFAGYLAQDVLRISEAYQAFMAGFVLDVFIHNTRRNARQLAANLAAEHGGD